MAGSFTVSGTNLIIDFKYTGPAKTVTDVATYAANMLFDMGVRAASTPSDTTFTSLTNQQRLDILDAYILRSFTDLAKNFKIRADLEVARNAAYTVANSTLNL